MVATTDHQVKSKSSQRLREDSAATPINLLDVVPVGHVFIAGGGGGIPTVHKDDWCKAIDAVIDKDHASAMLAADTGCDAMAILTGVQRVSINFNTPDQQDLDELTVAHAKK